MYLNLLLVTSPIPGWVPGLAVILLIGMALFSCLGLGAVIVFLARVGRELARSGKLPGSLARLRDAGHPVRRHQHTHYSAKLSEEIFPLTEAEAEAFGLDEHFSV